MDSDQQIFPNSITRLMIFEHENIGFYSNGDIIEISGMLQECHQVPNFKTLELEDTYQILVGTVELYGKEYVKRLDPTEIHPNTLTESDSHGEE
jgi:hypothetical protein